MKVHRVRKLIHIVVLSILGVCLILNFLSFSVDADSTFNSANTPVSVKFIRPIEPTIIEGTDITKEQEELLETQHYYIKEGFLPQTGVKRNLLLVGIGYLLVVFTSIQFFKGRNMQS